MFDSLLYLYPPEYVQQRLEQNELLKSKLNF